MGADYSPAKRDLAIDNEFGASHAIEEQTQEEDQGPEVTIIVLDKHGQVVAEIEISLARVRAIERSTTQMEDL